MRAGKAALTIEPNPRRQRVSAFTADPTSFIPAALGPGWPFPSEGAGGFYGLDLRASAAGSGRSTPYGRYCRRALFYDLHSVIAIAIGVGKCRILSSGLRQSLRRFR